MLPLIKESINSSFFVFIGSSTSPFVNLFSKYYRAINICIYSLLSRKKVSGFEKYFYFFFRKRKSERNILMKCAPVFIRARVKRHADKRDDSHAARKRTDGKTARVMRRFIRLDISPPQARKPSAEPRHFRQRQSVRFGHIR